MVQYTTGPEREHIRQLLCLLVALCTSATPASAQSVRGYLRDVTTDEPISVGLLSLLSSDSTILQTSLTDSRGFWELDVPKAGTYYIRAERLGYQTWTAGPLDVAADARLNTVFHLAKAPVALAPMEVNATALRRYLDASGFFDRQRGNFGRFITPEDIERRQASRLTDLLVGIPGVQRVAAAGGSVGPAQIHLRGSNLSQGGTCRPRVFVDGLMYSRGDSRPVRRNEGVTTELNADEDLMQRLDQALSLDDIGHPSSIAAIEVYRSAAQVPVQFGGSSIETLCGVIVVWTRTGRMRIRER